MSGFELHPQLQADTHWIASLAACDLLLHKNASVPWFILVPRGEFRDLDELPRELRDTVMDEIAAISDYLRQAFKAEKINVAALGNVVPKLHIHVIGRRSDDPCWPQPVWGNLSQFKEWNSTTLAQLKRFFSGHI